MGALTSKIIVTRSWKPTFWVQANFRQNSIEYFYDVLKFNFFVYLDKATIAVKFRTKSFFLLGDMNDL